MLAWGEALLAVDVDRVGSVERWGSMRPCSVVRAVGGLDGGAPHTWGGQLLDVVAGRDAQAPIRWLLAQPSAWREGIRHFGSLRSFDALPHAGQLTRFM